MAVGVFTFIVAFAVWYGIKAVMGLRVSVEEEIGGLDVGEHGIKAYPDFQVQPAFRCIRTPGVPSGLPRSDVVGEPAFLEAKAPMA